jgi:hypothetical protein
MERPIGRRAVTMVMAVALAGGCDGGDDATSPSTSAVAAASTAPTTSTSPAATTTSSTTTSTTTTAAPPQLQLVVEPVAALDGRAVYPQLLEDAGFVARAESPGHPGANQALVRIGFDGAITQEVPAPGLLSVFDVARAGEAWFAFTYDGTVCGVQPVERTSLALGPPLPLPDQPGCGGTLQVDSTDPAILLTTEVAGRAYFRIDTRAGAVTQVDLGTAVPEGYDVFQLLTFGGNTYAMADAATDPRTGDVATAHDGSDLAPLLVRVDGATGAVTAAPVAGGVQVAAGQLVARIDADRSQVIDPTTLAVTEVPATGVAIPDDEITTAGPNAWTFEVDDAGVITVLQRDPATSAVVRSVTAESGLDRRFTSWTGFAVGTDSQYVFGTQLSHRGDAPTTTHVYRAVLRPQG